jgi:hypothetical protein
VRFSNFGTHHYVVTASGGGRLRGRSDFQHQGLPIRVRLAADPSSGEVQGGATQGDRRTAVVIAMNGNLPAVPSTVARALPVTLAFATGELLRYAPFAEDAGPQWYPTMKGSWFNLLVDVAADGRAVAPAGPRTIVGRGAAAVGPRAKVEAWRYDHVSDDGQVRATTWVDDACNVVRFEGHFIVLQAASEAVALAAIPSRQPTER